MRTLFLAPCVVNNLLMPFDWIKRHTMRSNVSPGCYFFYDAWHLINGFWHPKEKKGGRRRRKPVWFGLHIYFSPANPKTSSLLSVLVQPWTAELGEHSTSHTVIGLICKVNDATFGTFYEASVGSVLIGWGFAAPLLCLPAFCGSFFFLLCLYSLFAVVLLFFIGCPDHVFTTRNRQKDFHWDESLTAHSLDWSGWRKMLVNSCFYVSIFTVVWAVVIIV